MEKEEFNFEPINIGNKEETIYDEVIITQKIYDDEIDPIEAGFMIGYIDYMN